MHPLTLHLIRHITSQHHTSHHSITSHCTSSHTLTTVLSDSLIHPPSLLSVREEGNVISLQLLTRALALNHFTQIFFFFSFPSIMPLLSFIPCLGRRGLSGNALPLGLSMVLRPRWAPAPGVLRRRSRTAWFEFLKSHRPRFHLSKLLNHRLCRCAGKLRR